jgi:hypothetical protein
MHVPYMHEKHPECISGGGWVNRKGKSQESGVVGSVSNTVCPFLLAQCGNAQILAILLRTKQKKHHHLQHQKHVLFPALERIYKKLWVQSN